MSPKTKTADGWVEGTSSVLDEINQKPCRKMKKVIDRGKRSKTLSEVKQVENIRICRIFERQVPYKRKSFLHINCEIMYMSTYFMFSWHIFPIVCLLVDMH